MPRGKMKKEKKASGRWRRSSLVFPSSFLVFSKGITTYLPNRVSVTPFSHIRTIPVQDRALPPPSNIESAVVCTLTLKSQVTHSLERKTPPPAPSLPSLRGLSIAHLPAAHQPTHATRATPLSLSTINLRAGKARCTVAAGAGAGAGQLFRIALVYLGRSWWLNVLC